MVGNGNRITGFRTIRALVIEETFSRHLFSKGEGEESENYKKEICSQA